MKTGVQSLCNYLNRPDSGACPGPRSGVRRNDKKWDFSTFYEIIKIASLQDNRRLIECGLLEATISDKPKSGKQKYWLTEKVMTSLDLSERQRQAVQHVKAKGRISNSEYQEIASVAKRTAHRDLADLVAKAVFIKIGTRGKGTFYKVRRNRATNGPNGPAGGNRINWAINGPNGPSNQT